MSGQEWAPGTVAVATVRGTPNLRVMRARSQSGRWGWRTVELLGGGALWHEAGHVTDVRPLVVLDLDPAMYDAPLLRNLVDSIRADWPSVANQIDAQTRPPKPPEPTGLGAVVRSRDGREWTRTARHGTPAVRFPWWPGESKRPEVPLSYEDVDAVEVLSEGVA